MTDTTNGAAEAAPEPEDVSLDDALDAKWEELNAEPVEIERDERGRFKSANAEEEPQEAAPEAEEAGEEPEEEEEAEEGAESVSEPPAHLPQALKDAWKDMSEGAREAVSRHQQDMDRKFSQQGRLIQGLQPIQQRLTDAIQKHPQFADLTPEQMAEGAISLMAVQKDLERDPANTVMKIAQEFGVVDQLRAHLSGQQPSDQSNYVAQLQKEIRDLKSTIEQSTGSIDERISGAISERETASVVQQFAAEQPHWDAVEPYLPQFIAIVQEQQPDAAPVDTLKAAYDMAVHAIPDVRAKVAATDKAAAKPDPDRARKAKKATSTNVRSTSTGSEKAKTMDELLSDTFDRIQAG